MSTTTTADEIRAHTRAMWGGVAGGWEQHADYVETRGAHVTELMLARTAPRPGERVLELASGAGDIAIAAAPLVAPGEVVVSDVAAEMVDIAARRAGARGLANVTPRVFGVEAIDDEDASYDVVLCREGLMFAVDPELAAREIARVLRPGGRTAACGLGAARAEPVAGVRVRCRQRAVRAADAAARHPRAVLAGRRRAARAGCWRASSSWSRSRRSPCR